MYIFADRTESDRKAILMLCAGALLGVAQYFIGYSNLTVLIITTIVRYIPAGVSSALINLGGNIITVGEHPEGHPWKIGIQNPLLPRGSG